MTARLIVRVLGGTPAGDTRALIGFSTNDDSAQCMQLLSLQFLSCMITDHLLLQLQVTTLQLTGTSPSQVLP